MLEAYATEHGLKNIRHFSDDGFSGTTFNRPAFEELLEEVERGRVGTVIVKDLSRLGRDYLNVGYYTEVVFPKHNVRFIAINNSVDSLVIESVEIVQKIKPRLFIFENVQAFQKTFCVTK